MKRTYWSILLAGCGIAAALLSAAPADVQALEGQGLNDANQCVYTGTLTCYIQGQRQPVSTQDTVQFTQPNAAGGCAASKTFEISSGGQICVGHMVLEPEHQADESASERTHQ